MIEIIYKIFIIYIWLPIVRFCNFHFKHRYLQATDRNIMIKEYLEKVIQNPNYIPSIPEEIKYEDELRDMVYQANLMTGDNLEFDNDVRLEIVLTTYQQMQKFYIL